MLENLENKKIEFLLESWGAADCQDIRLSQPFFFRTSGERRSSVQPFNPDSSGKWPLMSVCIPVRWRVYARRRFLMSCDVCCSQRTWWSRRPSSVKPTIATSRYWTSSRARSTQRRYSLLDVWWCRIAWWYNDACRQWVTRSAVVQATTSWQFSFLQVHYRLDYPRGTQPTAWQWNHCYSQSQILVKWQQ